MSLFELKKKRKEKKKKEWGKNEWENSLNIKKNELDVLFKSNLNVGFFKK
jgi:hypothetical protein